MAILVLLLSTLSLAQNVAEVTITEKVNVQVTATETVSASATATATDSKKTNVPDDVEDIARQLEKEMLKRAALVILQEGSCEMKHHMKCKVVRKANKRKKSKKD